MDTRKTLTKFLYWYNWNNPTDKTDIDRIINNYFEYCESFPVELPVMLQEGGDDLLRFEIGDRVAAATNAPVYMRNRRAKRKDIAQGTVTKIGYKYLSVLIDGTKSPQQFRPEWLVKH